MRILLPLIYLTCLLWHTAIADDDKPSWSWGTKEEKKVEASTDQSEEKSEANPRSLSYSDILSDESEQLVYVQPEQLFNATEEAAANIVVDEILQSGRQGRHLKEYDEVYTDPTIQEALQKGDDVQARHLIKERLCSLGLMQCDSSDLDPKHGSYVSPDELIYAQPVAIKPVGEPIASIPLRGPPRAIYHPSKPHVPYGSAKPIPGPPRRGYGPPPPPSIYPNKPIYSSGSSSASFHGSSSNLYEGFVPPYKPHTEFTPDRPYKFEPPTKVSVNSPSGSASSDVQQHVHHHFHHGAGPDGKLPTVIVNNPVPVPSSPVTSAVEALQSINNGYKQQISSSTFDNGFTGSSSFSTLGSGSQSGVNTGYQGIYGNNNAKPIFENSGPQSFGNSGSNLYAGQTHSGFYGSGASSNSFGAASSNSFGASVGSFGNTAPFYKKELNVNKGYLNGNSLQPFNGGGYADKYQGFESARQENFDCVCVPINQCPSQDVLGRKEDFYLNIDPRNVKTDIQAEESITITDNNGTMTVVRVPKELSKDDQVAEDPKTDEVKKISKREAEKKTDKPDEKSNIEPRLIGGYLDDNFNDMKKVVPTFGVSFGLPQQGGGGHYPLNPFGSNPVVNPYGSSIGGSGINLGLVSVNPLVSVQVTKDDYGKKVVKPLVNIHVTPNDFLVHKIEDLFFYKKQALFSKHEHYHQHHGHSKPQIHHYHHRPPPIYHSKPVYHHKPVYVDGPEFSGPPIHHHKPIYVDGPEFSGPPIHHHKPIYVDGPGNYGGLEFSEPPPGAIGSPGFSHDEFPSYGGGGPFLSNDLFKRNNYNHTVPGKFVPEQYANEHVEYGRDYSNYQENVASSSNFENYRHGKNLLTDDGKSFDRVDNTYGSASIVSNSQNPSNRIKFPTSKRRRRRDTSEIDDEIITISKRQAFYQPNQCGPRHVCCRTPQRPQVPLPGGNGNNKQCGSRHSKGINGRIKNPVYIDGDSEFGEYPWQAAILKKDSQESVYVCGGTLIDDLHILTAAHCVKTYSGFDLRVRLGEWDVNHDVEFYPYIERDVISVHVHPEFYAGTLYNDLAVLKLDKPVDWTRSPHISPACLPDPYTDYTGTRCWTTGWGKDAFGDFGKYQNILKEVDVPIINQQQCQQQLQNTRLGFDFKLHPGFICAGGEEGKDACKGDGGGPMVCERNGLFQVVGIVSWGIGCGQHGVPGVYVRVAHYLNWIKEITRQY
ncbi:uncharacterized protein LOC123297666 isoform X1 [Chrysoperla carnea]|uniref:uncharacterized protein LOC123297666 isoform X1 n=1 Tax=Chrysoperla carnea TaxID=189513 RepID=UPI001D097E9B|nr:uncharacterized protein LOC123297666 isoform X1 [Chrysoperla carnea]